MGRAERSWSGDGLLEGTAIPPSGVPAEPARPDPEPEPRKPGALRLMWRMNGPFIRPFLILVVLWQYAAVCTTRCLSPGCCSSSPP